MRFPLVFLDIDGVLNNHEAHPVTRYCTIDKTMAERFNKILEATDARFVVTSAWRYLMHSDAMRFEGLRNLLYSHWIDGGRFVGITRKDDGPHEIGLDYKGCPGCDRGLQITEWIAERNEYKGVPYVVLDDLDLGIREAGHPFIQTDGKLGLTAANAIQAIDLLRKGGAA
jgi:hypothetical protein